MTASLDEAAATEAEPRDPLVGRVLQDRYHVLGVLGRGGMGIVYLARHILIERVVAIKILHPQLTASAELVQRFHREARAAALAGNEHVIEVTDMGRLDDGSYFIVMEYLEGENLAQLVAKEGPLSIARAIAIASQICVALEAVHNAGIVHRDLKPENVFLVTRGAERDFVKVLDFGICKYLKDQPLTATGVAIGTPRFMSPEQLEARPETDHRADVYGVGAILFFALTGRGPFDRESLPRLLVSIWSEPAPRLRQLCPRAPEALELLVARTLEKSADQRFPSALELRSALQALALTDQEAPGDQWASISGIRETDSQPVTLAGLRYSYRAALLSLVSVMLLGCLLVAAWYSRPQPSQHRAPAQLQPTFAPRPSLGLDEPEPAPEAAHERPAPPPPLSEPRREKRRRPLLLEPTQVVSSPSAIEPPNTGEDIGEPVLPAQPRDTARPLAPEPAPARPPNAIQVETPLVPNPQELRRVFQ